VRAYRARTLNSHPSLPPASGAKGTYGIPVHRAALGAGCQGSGGTGRGADARYDPGPRVMQWPGPVVAGGTPESLAARARAGEHRILPATVGAGARARARDEKMASFRWTGPASFGLVQESAPSEEEVRQVLGRETGARASK